MDEMNIVDSSEQTKKSGEEHSHHSHHSHHGHHSGGRHRRHRDPIERRRREARKVGVYKPIHRIMFFVILIALVGAVIWAIFAKPADDVQNGNRADEKTEELMTETKEEPTDGTEPMETDVVGEEPGEAMSEDLQSEIEEIKKEIGELEGRIDSLEERLETVNPEE